jgi:hypothetical protein
LQMFKIANCSANTFWNAIIPVDQFTTGPQKVKLS